MTQSMRIWLLAALAAIVGMTAFTACSSNDGDAQPTVERVRRQEAA